MTSKFKSQKPRFRGLVPKNRLRRCLIHNSSCSMIGSTVNVFFFTPYLCTYSYELLRLTISWTSSARKYIISSVIHIKQHTVQKTEPKTETAVNLVKPKPNQKPQFFGKPIKPKSFFANRTPLFDATLYDFLTLYFSLVCLSICALWVDLHSFVCSHMVIAFDC